MNPKAICLPLACFRALRLFFHILYALSIARIYPALRKSTRQRITQQWSLDLLKILNVRWNAAGCQPPRGGMGCLFVANHISWLDVFAMNAAVPARFIAKSEVGDWPLFGWLARRTGALFIRRDALRDTARVSRLITAMLQQGECVALFPEGTSTDGTGHVRFNSPLLQGAIDAEAAVRPVAIRYHDGNGNHLADAAFIGDMTFMQSLWQVLCSPSLHVTLAPMPPIGSTGKDRRALAQQAQAAVNTALDALPAASFRPEAGAHTIHQLLTCSSSCGNNASLNLLPDYPGDDDAEPDPAATPVA
jgi:1-acyl-sn-glycerol-3-phosphate acyltransferase